MLVIVHDGDIQLVLQASLDLETLRCLDILQVDSSERGRDRLHGLDKLLRIFLVHFDIEYVDARKYLE